MGQRFKTPIADQHSYRFRPLLLILALASSLGLMFASSAQAAPSHSPLSIAALEGTITKPCGVATDSAGDIYVAEGGVGPIGKIKIYSPAGVPITEITAGQPCGLAVDSSGAIYVYAANSGIANKYTPTPLGVPPTPATTYALSAFGAGNATALAVDPSNQNVLISEAIKEVQEYEIPTGSYKLKLEACETSALDGQPTPSSNAVIKAALEVCTGPGTITVGNGSPTTNKKVTFIGSLAGIDVASLEVAGVGPGTTVTQGLSRISSFDSGGTLISSTIGTGVSGAVYSGVDVWGATGRIYAADRAHNKAYIFDPAGAAIEKEITGSDCVKGAFTGMEQAALAVDQSNGNVLVSDVKGHGVVDEFNAGGKCIDTIEHTPAFEEAAPSDIAVDSSATGNKGHVYVTSGAGAGGSVFSYGPLAPLFKLTVTKSGSGTGTVTSFLNGLTDGGIICGTGPACEHEYAEGELVTLIPTEDEGSKFKEWTGACTGSGACVVTMSTAKTVDAKFELVPAPAITGVSPTKGPLTAGTSVTINGTNLATATGVNFGSTAATITENTATQIKATAPAGPAGTVDVTVTTAGGTSATSDADKYTYVAPLALTVNKAGTGSGSVTCDGGACAATYSFGTEVTLAASAASGSNFAGWSGGNCSGAGGCLVTVEAATTITATFNANPVPAPVPAPVPVPVPSNEAKPGTAKQQGEAIALKMTVPGAGALKATGKNMATSKGTAKGAGSVTLKLKLNSAGKKQLKKKGKFKVKVKVVFTPTGGTPGTTTKTVTFKAKPAKKKH